MLWHSFGGTSAQRLLMIICKLYNALYRYTCTSPRSGKRDVFSGNSNPLKAIIGYLIHGQPPGLNQTTVAAWQYLQLGYWFANLRTSGMISWRLLGKRIHRPPYRFHLVS